MKSEIPKIPIEKSSFYKTVRIFLITAICTLLITACASGIIIASVSTNKTNTGKEAYTLALAHSEQKLQVKINRKKAAEINLPLSEYKKYLGLSPVLWLFESIGEILKN